MSVNYGVSEIVFHTHWNIHDVNKVSQYVSIGYEKVGSGYRKSTYLAKKFWGVFKHFFPRVFVSILKQV